MHLVAIELLRAVGPMAVSSANVGNPPAVTVDDAVAQLGDKVEVYLDGGHAEATAVDDRRSHRAAAEDPAGRSGDRRARRRGAQDRTRGAAALTRGLRMFQYGLVTMSSVSGDGR